MTIPQTASVVLPAGRLTASAVDVDRRTIEGILVPWDETGQPAINGEGRLVKVRRGALTLAASVTGIDTHDRPRRDVSTLIAHEQRPEGIWGRLKVDTTPAGDALLAAVAEGKRLGLSVEASELRVTENVDEVLGGVVDLVAHVDDPAFPSARVHSMTAALCPTTTQGEPSVTAPAPVEAAATVVPAAFDYAQLAAALAPHMTAAAAPAGLPTGGALTSPVTPTAEADAVTELARMQAAQAAGDTTPTLMAALADITNSDLPIFQRPAGAIGQQLWQNHSYTRRFVPLLNPKPLTSWKVTGWEFTTGPEVDDYAGDKAEVPTNEIGPIREIEDTAKRLAGGWDIDRKFRDFGDAAFWTWFYGQQSESYARKSDAKALGRILANVQSVTSTAPVDGYTRPDWATAPEAQANILSAVAVGTAYLEDTPLVEKGPDWILMNTQDWLSLLELTNLDLPAFLALLNVEPGKFQRSNQIPSGSVVLGVKQAIDFYELPGVPIRVEALDVARAGIDSAVYGYWASLTQRPGGIISVPLAAAG